MKPKQKERKHWKLMSQTDTKNKKKSMTYVEEKTIAR